METKPTYTVDTIGRRHNGIAGQYSYDVTLTYRYPSFIANGVTYPETTETHDVSFVGSVYGSPIVVVSHNWEIVVTDWRRFGDTLNPDWIRSFYADRSVAA